MIFDDTSIPGVLRIHGARHVDRRGSFERLFCAASFAAAGLEQSFLQTSLSRSRRVGTLRGMHLQAAPREEVKIVHCLEGRIYDVVADLRPWSPTYLRWEAHVLGPGDGALYVPRGVAHGFQTLTAGAVVLYEISEPFAPELSIGVRYDDPSLAIAWPLPPVNVSDRDLAFPLLGLRAEARAS